VSSVAEPEEVALLAQLTYASADAAGSSGGWQVKQTVGELDAATTASLTRRMPTTIEPTFPMPEYPVDGLPRRMLISTVSADDPRIAVWHSLPAGRDASSRPGNVYTQCALLAPTNRRPSLLWGSPDWRTPFGPKEVAATTLPSKLSVAEITPFPALAEFLFDPLHWRVGTLAVIVDAVQRALDGGPIVVLEVDDHVEASRWISAVSLCTDAVSAQAIHTSTYERARSCELWPDLGLHLVGVPRADDTQLAGLKGVVVIDSATDAMLGEWGGAPHRTARGDEIPVTPWSALVLSRCVGGNDLVRIADLTDEVRARLPGSVWPPAWPLALRDYVEEPNPAAADVLARSTPMEVERVPEYYEVVAGAVGTILGEDTESRWRALRGLAVSDSSLALSLAAGNFVTGAVVEPGWLAAQPESPRIPDAARPTMTREQHSAVLAGLRAQLEPGEPNAEWALAAMRSIDVVVSIGWDEGDIEGQLFLLASHLAVVTDLGPWFDDVVEHSAEPSRRYLREALLGLPNTVPSGTILALLGLATDEFLNSPDAITDGKVPPITAAAAAVVLSSPAATDDLRGRAQYLRLRHDLEAGRYAPEVAPPVLIGLADLIDLVRSYGYGVSERVVLAVAVRHPRSAQLQELVDALLEADHPQRGAVEALVSLGRPINTARSLHDYWQEVVALEQVVENGWVEPNALPRTVRSRAQAVVLTVIVVLQEAQATCFVDGTLPPLAEPEVAALGALAASLPAFQSPAEAIGRMTRVTVGSPERIPAVAGWVLGVGPEEDPLIDQIVCEALRAAGWAFDNDLIESAVYSLLREEGHRARALQRYLTKWVGSHNLVAGRGSAPWLRWVTSKRSEDD
jgi:hypothetical protein